MSARDACRMLNLAIFPWLRIATPVETDRFTIHPFEPGKAVPGATLQGTTHLERMASLYREVGGQAVREYTILQRRGGELLAELSPAELEEAFAFRDLLALCGLCTRSFFDDRNYVNADDFALNVVPLDLARPGRGRATQARRRDGTNTTLHTDEETAWVRRPAHVRSSIETYSLDGDLLRTLESVRETSLGQRIHEAAISFNLANTDRADIPESAELVLLASALEALFGLRKGNDRARALAAKIRTVWAPSLRIPLARSSRAQGRHRSWPSTLTDLWINDLFITRNAFAHGNFTSKRTPLWRPQEHLLLGAFLFPLLVKSLLADAGSRPLTKKDEFDVDSFERLADADLFVSEETWLATDGRHPWNEIRSRMSLSWGVAYEFAKAPRIGLEDDERHRMIAALRETAAGLHDQRNVPPEALDEDGVGDTDEDSWE
jgi:hypothetical protein